MSASGMAGALGPVARWVPVAAFIVVIAFQSRTPDLTFVPGAANDLLLRKMGHAGIYGILALLTLWALPAHRPGWIVPLAVATIVAIADELGQNDAIGRQGKLTDVLTDLTGAIAALVLARTWRHRRILAGRSSTAPSC